MEIKSCSLFKLLASLATKLALIKSDQTSLRAARANCNAFAFALPSAASLSAPHTRLFLLSHAPTLWIMRSNLYFTTPTSILYIYEIRKIKNTSLICNIIMYLSHHNRWLNKTCLYNLSINVSDGGEDWASSFFLDKHRNTTRLNMVVARNDRISNILFSLNFFYL